MTFQMYLLEHEMEAEERGRKQGLESVAIKMLRKGKSIEEVHEFTELPIQRIEELAADNCND